MSRFTTIETGCVAIDVAFVCKMIWIAASVAGQLFSCFVLSLQLFVFSTTTTRFVVVVIVIVVVCV